MFDETHNLFVMPQGIETRWASPENPTGARGQAAQANAGRKGAACFPLKAGEQRVLAEVSGRSGTVRRIWVTINDRSPQMLRSLRLDFFWDGAARPAVSAPLGDFFGMSLGRMAQYHSALFTSPEGRSFTCYIPMPFRTGMKMTVTNEGNRDLEMFFYDVDYTLSDPHGADVLYFHAHYRRENPTTLQQDYQILPLVRGKGRFLGCNVGVIADKQFYFHSWWGEGELKVYLDGDTDWPTLSGTGTEDYIGTGWGMGHYADLYQGCHIADPEHMRYGFYRFHVPDPIYFQRDIRVDMQQIGCWGPDTKPLFHYAEKPIYHAGPGQQVIDFSQSGGATPYGLFERQDDWSSCAYFYLDAPENGLPSLDVVDKRVAGLE
jgi:hypothetical protein